MLQSFKGLWFHCIKGTHTHKARCANIALCVPVFTFHVDNMTSFPSWWVTMPSLSALSLSVFNSHILWPAASTTKKKQTLNLFSSVCLSFRSCVYSGIWTDIHELVCVFVCVFSVRGWVEIFSRCILMKACSVTI